MQVLTLPNIKQLCSRKKAMYTYMRFLVNLNLAQYMVSRWFLLSKFNYNFGTCLDKFFTTLMVGMAVVLYQSINIPNVFTVLPMAWAEDKTMYTQVKLQKYKMMMLYMFKTKPFIKRLQNTNSFLLVECISGDCRDTLVGVQPSRIFLPEVAESFPLI